MHGQTTLRFLYYCGQMCPPLQLIWHCRLSYKFLCILWSPLGKCPQRERTSTTFAQSLHFRKQKGMYVTLHSTGSNTSRFKILLSHLNVILICSSTSKYKSQYTSRLETLICIIFIRFRRTEKQTLYLHLLSSNFCLRHRWRKLTVTMAIPN